MSRLRTRCLVVPLLAVILVVPACNEDHDTVSQHTAGTKKTPGKMENPAARLMEADRAFNRAVQAAVPDDRGRVWAGWFATDGRQILPGRVVQGRETIAALMGPAFSSPGYSLVWAPDIGNIAEGADFGWTSGRYTSTSEGPDGTVVGTGRYLTIWRIQADGSWKVEADTGVPDSED